MDKYVDILVQSFSLIRPVGDIFKLAQGTSFPAVVEGFLALFRLRSIVLCASVALPIFNITIPTYKDSNPPSQSLPQMLLNPIVVQTRKLLREAFERSFFRGYNGTRRPFVLEMHVFHPAFNSLHCLESIPSGEQARKKREAISNAVLSRAYRVAKSRNMEAGILDSEETGSEPSPKISRVDSVKVGGVLSFGEFEDDADAAAEDRETTLDRVTEELNA